MSDPKIIYTAFLFNKTVLAEYYEIQGETISYIKENALKASNNVGLQKIEE